jgi:hypothetical protein
MTHGLSVIALTFLRGKKTAVEFDEKYVWILVTKIRILRIKTVPHQITINVGRKEFVHVDFTKTDSPNRETLIQVDIYLHIYL